MIFDKLSLFADGLTVPTTANTTTYGKVLDLRKCGQLGIDGMLKVWAGVVGTVNTTGTVTTKFQTSADGFTWTDLVTETQSGSALMAVFLPCKGLKRFIRCAFAVGATQLNSAITVKAGLVDQFDNEDLPTVQTYNASAGAGLENLNTLGDALETALTLSASSASTSSAASSAVVTYTTGLATSFIGASSDITATLTSSGASISIGASATGTSYFIDGLGNKVSFTVG